MIETLTFSGHARMPIIFALQDNLKNDFLVNNPISYLITDRCEIKIARQNLDLEFWREVKFFFFINCLLHTT